jgi:peptidoglycan/LPS O-acetylase OafA/YrhL
MYLRVQWVIGVRTIINALNKHNSIGPGFDLLRVGLAIAILFIHCFPIATGQTDVLGLHTGAPATPILQPAAATLGFASWITETFFHKHNSDAHFANILVPMFFALSGFLVSGSAFRVRSVARFIALRGLRIIPALFVEVSLSALILGPLVTDYAWKRYFSDSRFFAYFGNILGRVRFELPGVFLSNPNKEVVNANLWTLPAEFYCYLVIGALLLSSALFSKKIFTLLFALASALWIFFDVRYRDLYASDIQRSTFLAVAFFLCGALIFRCLH